MDLARNVEPPILGIAGGKLDAPKRNPDHDLVAVGRQVPLGLVHEVRTQVSRGCARLVRNTVPARQCRALGDRAVGLHAEWIDGEDERLTRVDERTDNDVDVVVAADVVPVGECDVYRAVRLERADAEIQGGRRVPDEHLRGIHGWLAIDRRVLRESGEHGGLLPDRCAQRAVDRYRLVDPWHLDQPLTGAAVVNPAGALSARVGGDTERRPQPARARHCGSPDSGEETHNQERLAGAHALA